MRIQAAVVTLISVGVLSLSGCSRPPDGAPIDADLVFGQVGLFNGEFSYPRAIDALGDSVVVIDKSARVQRFDANTGAFLGGFSMPEWELGKPTGVTLGPDINDPTHPVIYVADSHYHRVCVYDLPDDPDADSREKRQPKWTLGEYGTGDGQFVYVSDVALLTDESGAVQRLYVSEYGGHDRLSVFTVGPPDEQGHRQPQFAFHIGTFGEGPGQVDTKNIEFERPQAMAIDQQRQELIVLDDCNHRIGILTLDGALKKWIGDDPDEAQFLNPQGFVLMDDRKAMVAEFLGNQVQVVDLDSGASLGIYGHAGRGDGEVASPWGVAMIGPEAFVLDSGNNRVMRFRPGGQKLAMPWKLPSSFRTAGGTP